MYLEDFFSSTPLQNRLKCLVLRCSKSGPQLHRNNTIQCTQARVTCRSTYYGNILWKTGDLMLHTYMQPVELPILVQGGSLSGVGQAHPFVESIQVL